MRSVHDYLADQDAIELLEALYHLALTDETWTDDNFVAMVNKYKSIRPTVNLIIEGGDLALDALTSSILARSMNSSPNSPNRTDRAEMEAFRAEWK